MRKLFLLTAFAIMSLAARAQYREYNAQIPFQSTSAMQTSGSRYTSTPSIGENGMAIYNEPSYSPGSNGPRRSVMDGTPTTPGEGQEPFKQPIGDCPILLLVAFGIIYLSVWKIHSNKYKPVKSTSTNG